MNSRQSTNPLALILTLTLLVLSCGQSSNYYDFIVLPSSSYIDVSGAFLAQASPQACYASCQSCQILTNLCEQCYVPYFSKTPQGTCPLTGDYTLQSSSNSLREGAAFSIVAESWSNQRIVNCSAINNNLNFQSDLIAIQPIVPTQQLTYNRTLSLHNYLVVRFELITTNWNTGSKLQIQMYNQANSQIVDGGFQVDYLPNVPKESLCSAGAVDQRFSVTIKVRDVNTTSLSLSMLSTSGTFSLATFALISGFCHASCSSCSYTTDPTACLGCNYFLKQISDGSCSECPQGFKFTSTPQYSFCQKCPIQYQSCTAAQTSCYYPQLNTSTSNDCSLVFESSHYDQSYYVNDQTFPGSLFTVNGLPSPSQYVPCGNQPLSSYSYVGPALAYQPITRIFTNLRPHLSLSLSFNVFVVDADFTSKSTKFQIYLNGELYDIKYVALTGMSNVCGGDQLQIFTTFPPTQFYQNNSTDLNLTLVADTAWGLRNLRIVYEVCDANCLVCGSMGCERCLGYLQVQDGRCQECPEGFGKNGSAPIDSVCFKCPANCLNCTLGASGAVECLLCTQPFFLFQKACKKKTNVADTVTPGPLAPINSSNTSPPGTCSLVLPTVLEGSDSVSNTTTNFAISSAPLTTVVTLSQTHYRSIVQFYLMRLGRWDPQDRLDVYLNDLLMLSKNYTSYGNKYCTNSTNSSDTDYLSFESLDFTDNNQSLSIYFEVVSASGLARSYGVGPLKVYPVGCKACLIYPFTYRIQYNYDEALNVVVEFSRVYRESNQELFKKIFVLTLNGNQLDYSIISNNSVIYTLQAYPLDNVLQGKLKLTCVYPQLVATNINDTVNGEEPFFSRLLQESSTYSNSKVVENSESSTDVVRFVPVENPGTVDGVRTFFQVVTRIVIYVGFALFFFGLQTIGTHFMHNLQKIWLHIFLAALAAPSLLRQVLSGFRESQNQNITINPSQWQSGLPTQLYYDSRSYFYQYYTDINFFRNIYNIGLAFAILIVYLAIMHVISRKYITREMTQTRNFLRHWKVTFHRRPLFYVNSIIFYQYLTLVFASMLQFTSISNQTEQGAFTGISGAAAVIAFLIATIYPLANFLWLKHKQEDLGRGLHIQFANRYHEIYFRFVKRNIWGDGQITYAERLYNLYRYGQLWWYCLVVTALAYNPQAQLYLLLITQALHLFLVLYTKLSRNFFFRICKVLELAFFVGLEIILLVCESQKETLTVRSMRTLGGVAIAFLFFIVFLSLVRSIYNGYLLHKEYMYRGMEDKVHARQGQVIRRDEYYDSEEEGEELAGTERV